MNLTLDYKLLTVRNAFFLDSNTPARKVLTTFRATEVIIPEYTSVIFYRKLSTCKFNSSLFVYRFRSATEFHACIACIQSCSPCPDMFFHFVLLCSILICILCCLSIWPFTALLYIVTTNLTVLTSCQT